MKIKLIISVGLIFFSIGYADEYFIQKIIHAHNKNILDTDISSNNRYLVTTGLDNRIKIWNPKNYEMVKEFKYNKHLINTVHFTDDETKIVAGTLNKILFFDLSKKYPIDELIANLYWVKSISFSPTAKYIACGGTDNNINIWYNSSHTFKCSLNSHKNRISSLVFGPSDNYLLSASHDKKIFYWDLYKEKIIREYSGHEKYITDIQFSIDYFYFVSSSADKTIRIWNTQTGECLKLLKGHKGVVKTLCFSSDGQYLFSGDNLGEIKIWNFTSKKCIKSLKNSFATINDLITDQQDKILISVDSEGNLILWRINDILEYDRLKTRLNTLDIKYKGKIKKNTKNYFLPKGEFENTAQYKKRLKEGKEYKKLLEEKFEIEQKRESEIITNEITGLTSKFVTTPIDHASLGKYEADENFFRLYYNDLIYNIYVPQTIAKTFKKEFNSYQVIRKDQYFLNDKNQLDMKNEGIYIQTTENQIFSTNKVMIDSLVPEIVVTSFEKSDSNHDNILSYGENFDVIIKIKNKGKGLAQSFIAELNPKTDYPYLHYNPKVFVNNILPGEEKIIEFTLYSNTLAIDNECMFNINFDELNGYFPDSVEFLVKTEKLLPPSFVVDVAIEDQNDNVKIEKREEIKVTSRIFNVGGKANNISIQIIPGDNIHIQNEDCLTKSISEFKAKSSEDITFSFETNMYVSNSIPIDIAIKYHNDELYRKPLGLKLNTYLKRPQDLPPADTRIIEIHQNSDLEKMPKSRIKRPNAIAIIIGNKDYVNKDIPNVDFAEHDLDLIEKYLISTLGYKKENIKKIINATKMDFEVNFGTDKNYKGELYNNVIPNDTEIFIYYTGHGAPDLTTYDGYFVPVTSNPDNISLTGYSIKTLYENLAKIEYKHLTVVIDACFCGISDGGALVRDISPVGIKVKNPIFTKGDCNIYTASENDQVSHWYREKQHSLFTYFFLKGLKGDADSNRDNILTSDELKIYLEKNVNQTAKKIHHRDQTPTFYGENKAIVKYW